MLKEFFINTSIKKIQESFPDFDEIKIEQLRYGLEGIYLTVSKLIIIFLLAYFLKIFKEVLWLTFLFNIIRLTSFGVHADKSLICLLISLLIFLGIPFILKVIYISFNLKLIICLLCFIIYFLYAPADTYKRPIISLTRRKKLKRISLSIVTLFIIGILTSSNTFLVNNLMAAIMVQAIMIMPVTYHIFGQKYNNYLNYQK